MVNILKELLGPISCPYLPDQKRSLERALTHSLTDAHELSEMLQNGWIYHPDFLNKPRCQSCSSCWPLRVKALEFRPNKTQRKVLRTNAETHLVVGQPQLDPARIDLYTSHHLDHEKQKGGSWKTMNDRDSEQSIKMYINSSPPVTESAFYRDDRLVAVCYSVDLDDDGCVGAYYYYDPDFRHLSLGTLICLSVITSAAERNLPYVYLGNMVSGCQSLEYKAKFKPNQVLRPDGIWHDFCS